MHSPFFACPDLIWLWCRPNCWLLFLRTKKCLVTYRRFFPILFFLVDQFLFLRGYFKESLDSYLFVVNNSYWAFSLMVIIQQRDYFKAQLDRYFMKYEAYWYSSYEYLFNSNSHIAEAVELQNQIFQNHDRLHWHQSLPKSEDH